MVGKIPAFLAILALGACTAKTVEPVDPPVSDIDRIIADAADRAARANVAVSEVEVAIADPQRAGPGQTIPPSVRLPDEIVQKIDLDWQGPVEPMLQALADRAGYTFRVIGRAPATPVTVSITQEDVPLHDVVREAGTMVNDVADVILNPSLKMIEMRYGNS